MVTRYGVDVRAFGGADVESQRSKPRAVLF